MKTTRIADLVGDLNELGRGAEALEAALNDVKAAVGRMPAHLRDHVLAEIKTSLLACFEAPEAEPADEPVRPAPVPWDPEKVWDSPSEAVRVYVAAHPGCKSTDPLDALENRIKTACANRRALLASTASNLVKAGDLRRENGRYYPGAR